MARFDEELAAQPDVAARLVSDGWEAVTAVAAAVEGRFDQVLAVGRGSSDNAARYLQYLLALRNERYVGLATPSVASVHDVPVRLPRALVVAVSQSGQSPDVVAVVAQARAQGNPTLAITNDPAGPLAMAAELTLDLAAGEERSIAATKTYTASLLTIALLSQALRGEPSPGAAAAVPGALRACLGAALPDVPGLGEVPGFVVGRGYEFATAHEVALKVMELTGVPMLAYSPADLRHGPVAAVRAGTPVLLAGDWAGREELATELHARRAVLVALGGATLEGTIMVEVPGDLPGWLAPLATVVPGQRLAAVAARAHGVDVDTPHDLRKITRTR